MPTITYHFGSQSSEVEEPEKQEVKKPRHVVRRKKKLEIDTEWIKDKIEVRGQYAGVFTMSKGFFGGSGERHTHTPIGELSEPTQNVNTNKKNVPDV